ncbi:MULTISPECIES: hypothetical protein [Nocardia]|uniref:Uncharacterized protein n=1 Tax=Nocardia aurea TaxID=2144174 RepID=A0ABV3FR03_9NOCA|nr:MULTISPECIES: hypothetical protein [Nocardia]
MEKSTARRGPHRIGLADIVREYGAAAVLRRVADLRGVGLSEPAAAIELEMAQLSGTATPPELISDH